MQDGEIWYANEGELQKRAGNGKIGEREDLFMLLPSDWRVSDRGQSDR